MMYKLHDYIDVCVDVCVPVDLLMAKQWRGDTNFARHIMPYVVANAGQIKANGKN